MNTYAVIDFETTGLSPEHGARPTEIAIALVKNGKIIDTYQSLMNPGVPIPYRIQDITGITNAMVRNAPSVEDVMGEAAGFVDGQPLVAHNAAFDRQFWDAELQQNHHQEFVCSMLLARRIFPKTPNHKLETLVKTLCLPIAGRHHRALADAKATAHLLLRLKKELLHRFRRSVGLSVVTHELLLDIQSKSRAQIETCVRNHVRNHREDDE